VVCAGCVFEVGAGGWGGGGEGGRGQEWRWAVHDCTSGIIILEKMK